ncbi:MAG: zf-HC2 domain-containing protein [Desulfovibrionaceae bacterium]|nr:zf-HC2 domain-containing protein [Desulfovibrionaceae bacterium]
MRCRTARRRLNPFLDDRLGDRERLALMAHLSACERCRATRDLYQVTRAALAAQGPAEPPPGLAIRAANLALAAAREPERRPEPASYWLHLLRWPALATASAAACLALVLFLQAPGEPAPPAQGDAGSALAQLVSMDDLAPDPMDEGARVLGQEVE